MTEKNEHWFSWAWRPAMSWMVILLFFWSALAVPTLNAIFGLSIPLLPTNDLVLFSGLWLTIYGGGHTLKSIFAKEPSE